MWLYIKCGHAMGEQYGNFILIYLTYRPKTPSEKNKPLLDVGWGVELETKLVLVCLIHDGRRWCGLDGNWIRVRAQPPYVDTWVGSKYFNTLEMEKGQRSNTLSRIDGKNHYRGVQATRGYECGWVSTSPRVQRISEASGMAKSRIRAAHAISIFSPLWCSASLFDFDERANHGWLVRACLGAHAYWGWQASRKQWRPGLIVVRCANTSRKFLYAAIFEITINCDYKMRFCRPVRILRP